MRTGFVSIPFFGALLLITSLWGPAPSSRSQASEDKAPAAPALSAEQKKKNLDAFEYVWQTIRDTHWDPKLGGLNWQAIHEEYRPQLEKAESMSKAREIMTNMILRLGQSHFRIIPKEVYKELDRKPEAPAAPTTKQGEPGFTIRVVEGQALVVQVTAGTPAAKLGVRPGWVLARVEGKDLGPAVAAVRKAFKDSLMLDLHLVRTVMERLHGKVGDKVALVFRNDKDEDVPLKVPMAEPQGARAQLGHLPAMYVHYESRKLEPNIWYFSLNAFFDPPNVMKAFEAAVKDNLKANGFILDLRGNPGGIGFMAVGIGNWFVNQPEQKLGTMTTRQGPLQFVLNPRLETFAGPLAILVDGCSGSTSEILAGGLQDLKRARVFGTRTAGAALPSVFERLPNGDGFQYAIADYVSTGGKRLEGHGVRPDEEVTPSRQALLAGQDPVLEAAVRWIRAGSKTRSGNGI